jgi:hypothetical protein
MHTHSFQKNDVDDDLNLFLFAATSGGSRSALERVGAREPRWQGAVS